MMKMSNEVKSNTIENQVNADHKKEKRTLYEYFTTTFD